MLPGLPGLTSVFLATLEPPRVAELPQGCEPALLREELKTSALLVCTAPPPVRTYAGEALRVGEALALRGGEQLCAGDNTPARAIIRSISVFFWSTSGGGVL